MGVFTFESEATSVIPPPKVFKAFGLESENHIPKAIPNAIQSVEILEGDGGPGSIKKISFCQGSQFSYVKHKIESLDTEKLTYCYTIIEGDAVGESIQKVDNEIRILASADGGSVVKSRNKHFTKEDYEVKEEQIKAGKEKGLGLFRATEKHVLEHPDYN